MGTVFWSMMAMKSDLTQNNSNKDNITVNANWKISHVLLLDPLINKNVLLLKFSCLVSVQWLYNNLGHTLGSKRSNSSDLLSDAGWVDNHSGTFDHLVEDFSEIYFCKMKNNMWNVFNFHYLLSYVWLWDQNGTKIIWWS
jgi:hypothetical protein